MTKLWRIRPHDPQRIAILQREANVSAVVAQLLAGRGLHDAQQIRDFLNPKLTGLRDPDELPGAADAADRLMQRGARVGRLSSMAITMPTGSPARRLLYECLTLLGGQVSYYVPHRIDEGYGLHDDALRTLAQRGASLVVTVDCGIASVGPSGNGPRAGPGADHHRSS